MSDSIEPRPRRPRASRKRAGAMLGEPSSEAPSRRKVMVIVHGAGNLTRDYYEKFVEQVSQRLGRPFDYMPVFYGDVTLSTARLSSLAARDQAAGAINFQIAFQRELEDAYASLPRSERPASITAFALPGRINALATITKDVTLYLFDSSVSGRARERVTEALDEASRRFDEIVLFSHSLGTVVALDALRMNADRYRKIACWFTTGSPLAKLRTLGMRTDDLGAITTEHVRHWYNLYDTSDIISDALGPSFPRPGYRLHDIFVDVAIDPVGSHDYMNNPETLDMVADVMR